MAKSKAALAAAQTEIATLSKQLEDAKAAVELASTNANAAGDLALKQVKDDLANAQDDLETFKRILAESQEAFTADMEATKAAHKREVEGLAGSHNDTLKQLKGSHEDVLGKANAEKATLQGRLEDERDAKEKALGQVESLQAAIAATPAPAPITSPRNSGATPSLSKEEVEKLHQAHNARIIEMEAEHEKALEALKEELAEKEEELAGIQSELETKGLEMGFMATDKEEVDNDLAR